MKKKNIILAIFALSSMVSCGEKFFDLQPNYEVMVDKTF